jgi:hypothetical protein
MSTNHAQEESLRLRGILAGEHLSKQDTIANESLRAALDACLAARALIEPEQAKIRPLIAAAANDIERRAREYQHDLIAWQLERAAESAERRIAHFKQIRDFAVENARCAADTPHWFKYYAWTVDPRCPALAVMPLELFDFQVGYVEWLDLITFELQSCGVVEKSRTMGATETALRWMLKHWRYRHNFFGMPLSANEDLVDSKKDPGTLFEKLRFQLRLLPAWMLPKGFSLDRDMPYMQLSNPETGSILQGDAPTANVGRQRRLTFILKDESAMWPNGGFQQHTSLSRSSNTIVDVSSVQGKLNKFHDLAHDNRTPKFEMDWHEHPWLDDRWYAALPYGYLGPAMTEEEIAQEIDRNYEASQPGKVIKNCREEYCFITWAELVAGFERYQLGFHFKGADGRYKIPQAWNWGRVTDYGMSAKTEDDTHIWAYSLFARPQQAFPFTDSIFFFCSLPVMPIGAGELQAFSFYSQLEREFGVRGLVDNREQHLRRPLVNDMSHEAADPKEVLRDKCGDNWSLPDLDFFKGVSKLRFHFELTDKHLPNPFRPDLPGRSRIYFVAPDGEYQLAFNERGQSYFVTPSKTQRGYKRLRGEISSWHFPPEERGKPVQKMRPKPIFDDIITTVRYALARWGVQAAPLTQEQKVVAQMTANVRPEAVAQIDDPHERQKRLAAQMMQRRQIEQGMIRPGRGGTVASWRDLGGGR